MTTIQILRLDESRDNGRARADEQLAGNRYIISNEKGQGRDQRPCPQEED